MAVNYQQRESRQAGKRADKEDDVAVEKNERNFAARSISMSKHCTYILSI